MIVLVDPDHMSGVFRAICALNLSLIVARQFFFWILFNLFILFLFVCFFLLYSYFYLVDYNSISLCRGFTFLHKFILFFKHSTNTVQTVTLCRVQLQLNWFLFPFLSLFLYLVQSIFYPLSFDCHRCCQCCWIIYYLIWSNQRDSIVYYYYSIKILKWNWNTHFYIRCSFTLRIRLYYRSIDIAFIFDEYGLCFRVWTCSLLGCCFCWIIFYNVLHNHHRHHTCNDVNANECVPMCFSAFEAIFFSFPLIHSFIHCVI